MLKNYDYKRDTATFNFVNYLKREIEKSLER